MGFPEAIAAWNRRPPRAADDATVERVARAIAVNGFGRQWDDFAENDAGDTDQGDLLEYARAAIAAVVPGADADAEPVAWRYRWKLDGEWTNWRVADHSQKAAALRDLEEEPLYRATPPDADRLMKLAELWVDARAELCRIATKRVPIEDNAAHYQQVRAADAKCESAEAAFRAALSSPGSPASGGVR